MVHWAKESQLPRYSHRGRGVATTSANKMISPQDNRTQYRDHKRTLHRKQAKVAIHAAPVAQNVTACLASECNRNWEVILVLTMHSDQMFSAPCAVALARFCYLISLWLHQLPQSMRSMLFLIWFFFSARHNPEPRSEL